MSTVATRISLSPRPRKPEAEDARRRQLIEATIDTIAELGFNASTIVEIAGRAGVSTGLVAFYFRDKDGLLEATLRFLAGQLAAALTENLATATTPRERIQALIDANLGESQFARRIATVWLAFWGQVPHSPRFGRVQRVYERRMLANLVHDFRAFGSRAEAVRLAKATAALIDGVWLRAALSSTQPDSRAARQMVGAFVDAQLALLRLALLQSDPAP